MDIFYPITRFFSNRQSQGEQLSGPTEYATASASPVTEQSALQLSAVWSCVRLISQTVASLPIIVYKRTPDGRVKDDAHWFSLLMSHKPNRYQNKYEFYEYQLYNLTLHGNCYAKITRIGGRIVSLMPMAAPQVEVSLVNGEVVYYYTHDNVVEALAAESVWHVRINADWLVGRSPLAFGRNIFGVAQSTESAVTKIYSNGAKPSGTLMLDKLLKPEQREAIRKNFSSLTTSDDNRLLVLELGMKFEPISLSPQDIELLASRRFNIEEICRWFGVPSVLVNDTAGSTTWGSGIEQIVAGFYKLNLRPILEALETSTQSALFGEKESKIYEVEHSFEALLRSSQKERFDGYRIGITSGIITPNEARAQEWLPMVEGGDKLYIQGAMMPIDQLAGETDADETDTDRQT